MAKKLEAYEFVADVEMDSGGCGPFADPEDKSVWVYLKAGYCWGGGGAMHGEHSEGGCMHFIHEATRRECRAEFSLVLKCDCKECQKLEKEGKY